MMCAISFLPMQLIRSTSWQTGREVLSRREWVQGVLRRAETSSKSSANWHKVLGRPRSRTTYGLPYVGST